MQKALRLILFVSIPILSAGSFAQTERPQPVWTPFAFFVGSWKGTGEGESGSSTIEREYQYVLKGKFLQVRNKSTYPPQNKNPKGEVHEDWGMFSHDRARKQFVLRQFHVEGFVSQYVSDPLAPDAKRLVFVSENIENIGAGWKARETYKILNANEFIETFELAAPGKEFNVYTESHFIRKK